MNFSSILAPAVQFCKDTIRDVVPVLSLYHPSVDILDAYNSINLSTNTKILTIAPNALYGYLISLEYKKELNGENSDIANIIKDLTYLIKNGAENYIGNKSVLDFFNKNKMTIAFVGAKIGFGPENTSKVRWAETAYNVVKIVVYFYNKSQQAVPAPGPEAGLKV